jgi:UDP-N-acetylmuramyl tripeptide synthase
VILIAGKGHETTQDIAGTRLPFSDHEVARKALQDRTSTSSGERS